MSTARRPRGPVLWGALLVLALASFALAQPDWLRSRLVRWFGPPQVELQESFTETGEGAVFDHSAFDRLLSTYVDKNGFVDYRGLLDEAAVLDAYIAALADAPMERMGRDERLALLINGYNAFTLRLILDYYPVDSIRDIPGAERWDAVRWELGGQTFSLNQLEHEQVRPNFREPRIHFALVCAAVGCPPLRTEAYTGERLEEQLEDQSRFTHENERWVRYTAGQGAIELTRLYEWYAGDFEQVAGAVLAYVARFRDDLATDLAAGASVDVRFLDYDWTLNERSR